MLGMQFQKLETEVSISSTNSILKSACLLWVSVGISKTETEISNGILAESDFGRHDFKERERNTAVKMLLQLLDQNTCVIMKYSRNGYGQLKGYLLIKKISMKKM